MNILEKINMNLLNWLIDSKEKNRKKMLLLLKGIEQQVKSKIVYSLLEIDGKVDEEKLDIILYEMMRDICRDELKDESLMEELNCYKKLWKQRCIQCQ